MGSGDLIDFDIIEGQKENIQCLPGGRSARKLVDAFSPPGHLHKLATPTPRDTKNINDCIRAEYEAEVAMLAESDDPLEIFDRYVQWTLDAYPSAQATPQSGLHKLLERATKTLVGYTQYKNDPRHLKLWIHYVHFFSDSPRETFLYLARQGIGESLALFYEEYAAWLEGAGRWTQAEEVYKLGMEREARPATRLMRKFKEFEERMAQHPEVADSPSSPALPKVRPALVAKIDPFAAPSRPADPHAPRPNTGVGRGSRPRSGKSKLAVFSDVDAAAPALGAGGPGSKGWDTIGSLAERKKENIMEPKPWVGEVLKAGGKKRGSKMAVFRDQSKSQKVPNALTNQIFISACQHQVTVNPHSGKKEWVFVDLSVLYPNADEPGSEFCFEEVWAINRGWMDIDCNKREDVEAASEATFADSQPPQKQREDKPSVFSDDKAHQTSAGASKLSAFQDKPPEVVNLSKQPSRKLFIHRDGPVVDENGAVVDCAPRQNREKAIEVNETMVVRHNIDLLDENGGPQDGDKGRRLRVVEVNETQLIKAKLDSPTGPKMAKRKKSQGAEPTMTIHTRAATDDIYDIFNQPIQRPRREEDDDDLSYESDDYTCGGDMTTRNISTSDTGGDEDDRTTAVSSAKSVSDWSDFTARKHVPKSAQDLDKSSPRQENADGNATEASFVSAGDEILAGKDSEAASGENDEEDGLCSSAVDDSPPRTRTIFIPIPPEDYVAPTRPYRDPAEAANNRLPFMTPITERTESSLGTATTLQQQPSYHAKAFTPTKEPSPVRHAIDEEDAGSDGYDEEVIEINEQLTEPLSSPIREVVTEIIASGGKIVEPQLRKAAEESQKSSRPLVAGTFLDPISQGIHNEILGSMEPDLQSHEGCSLSSDQQQSQVAAIRKWAKSNAAKPKADCTGYSIDLPSAKGIYTLKQELGSGAFGPVYLVENSAAKEDDMEDPSQQRGIASRNCRGIITPAHRKRRRFEAVKMEEGPPSSWEFYILRLAHDRLGHHERATRSLTTALEIHMFSNVSLFFLPFHPYPTLLNVVNFMHGQGMMEEQLVMFFAIELLRTVEALHTHHIAHGDLKIDNFLLRLDHLSSTGSSRPSAELSPRYRADGSCGWGDRGLVFIDWGRAIDFTAFEKDVEFIADWDITDHDPIEMREGRPWTWHIDYHGLANTIHCALFGKYIEVVRADGGGQLASTEARRYKIRESLKRYWQFDIWGEFFDMLINPAAAAKALGERDGRMPLLNGMRRMREQMEGWLEKNCDKGTGLKALLAKIEGFAVGEAKKRGIS